MQHVSLAGNERIVAANATEDALLLVIDTGDMRVLRRNDEIVGRIPVQEADGERLFAGSNTWWYAVGGWSGRQYGTWFVTPEGMRFVKHRAYGPRLLLPLEGDTPGALFLHYRPEGGMEAFEVTAAGERGGWRFDEPSAFGRPISTASRLPDGRIALVTIDGRANAPKRVLLHILGNDGAVDGRVLRDGEVFVDVASAVDRSGRMVIAIESHRGITSAVLDEAMEWDLISVEGERASAPELVATPHGVVTAWTGNGRVRLRQGDTFADAGPSHEPRASLFLGTAGEELTVVWESSVRRMPTSLAGASLLCRMCAILDRASGHSEPASASRATATALSISPGF